MPSGHAKSFRARLLVGATALVGLLAAPKAGAQVVSNPNQIRGSVAFSNADPEIVGLLTDPLLRGITEVEIVAQSRTPAPATEHRSTSPGDGAATASYEVTVEASAAGIAHLVQPVARLGATDTYSFDGLVSAPVHPEPEPDVELDFIECAALARVHFVDDMGGAVTVDHARVYAGPARPANGSRFAAEAVVPRSLASHALLVPSSAEPMALAVEYDIHDWDQDEVFELDAGLACDEVVDLSVVVPASALATSRITGDFDLLGFEIMLSPDPWAIGGPVISSHGYKDNDRQFNYHDRYEEAVHPADGPFLLEDIIASDAFSGEPFEHDVKGSAVVRNGSSFAWVGTPEVGVIAPAGETVDLGDRLVHEHSKVDLAFRIHGPDPRPGLQPVLARSRAVAEPDDLERRLASLVWMRGGGSLVHAPLMGTYDRDAGVLESRASAPIPARWEPAVSWGLDRRSFIFHPPSDPTLGGEVRLWLAQEPVRQPRWLFEPGSEFQHEESICVSRVRLRFRSESAPLFEPYARIGGSFVGEDPFGVSWRYNGGCQAQGAPTSEADAATEGELICLVPVGDHTVRPSMKTLSPTGGVTETDFPPFSVSVGCRQDLQLTPSARVFLTADLPVCIDDPMLTVDGEAQSDVGLDRVEIQAGNAPPVVVCTACGPVVPFSQPLDLEPGTALVRVTAVAANGDVAIAEAPVRYLAEPSARDLRPESEPLRVRMSPAGLHLTWEPRALDEFNLYSGSLESLWSGGTYDHVAEGACRDARSARDLPMPVTNRYYLVGSDCGFGEGSVGRDSAGNERPAGLGCR